MECLPRCIGQYCESLRLIRSPRNMIVFTIFQLIPKQTEYREESWDNGRKEGGMGRDVVRGTKNEIKIEWSCRKNMGGWKLKRRILENFWGSQTELENFKNKKSGGEIYGTPIQNIYLETKKHTWVEQKKDENIDGHKMKSENEMHYSKSIDFFWSSKFKILKSETDNSRDQQYGDEICRTIFKTNILKWKSHLRWICSQGG